MPVPHGRTVMGPGKHRKVLQGSTVQRQSSEAPVIWMREASMVVLGIIKGQVDS